MKITTLALEKRSTIKIIRLNRPEAMNALNATMMVELDHVLSLCEKDDDIKALIITGSEKAFAAGADIKQMKEHDYMSAYKSDFLSQWDKITEKRKPIIAAIDGFALGGGCELAMMCDLIIASDKAQFGQPEITLGIIPGAGGTQRLTRAVGKAKAMDMILTGRLMSAEEAERSGLIARLVPQKDLMETATEIAEKIAQHSTPAIMAAKEAINMAFETPLSAGCHIERTLFYARFASQDQKEGMNAFSEKRPPHFNHE